MKTILIIGCGYLGSVVAKLAQASGIKVFATTRSRTVSLTAQGIIPIICDVTNPQTFMNLPQVDGIVHCVGMDRNSGKSMKEVYIDGLSGIAQHFKNQGFQGKFVHVSSTSVYSQNDGELIDESCPTLPNEGSGKVVLEAENSLRAILPNAIILRFAGIYGPGRLLRGKAILSGDPIVCDADRYLNLIHVADGARVCLAALSQGKNQQTYNVSDDEPSLRRNFYNQLAQYLNANPPTFILPDPNKPATPHEGTNRRISNLKMKTELLQHLSFPSYREGLKDCVEQGAFA